MTGIRTACRNNPATGRVGCGAAYGGGQLHCVAPADWSAHDDGLCHETFASISAVDGHYTKAGHVDPRTAPKIVRDDRGIWRCTGDPGYWSTRRPTVDPGSTQTPPLQVLDQSGVADDVWATRTDEGEN